MSWVPLHETDAWFQLSAHSEAVTMVGSTVFVSASFADLSWYLYFGTPPIPRRVRVTSNIESVGQDGFMAFYYSMGEETYDGVLENENPDSSAFLPSPAEFEITPRGESYYLNFALSNDITAMQAQFLIEVWGGNDPPKPEPEPPGGCFWTDIVNATQVCSAPPPDSTAADFLGPEGNGSGNGVLRLRWLSLGEPAPGICNAALFDALSLEPEVTITGIADAGEPPAGTEWWEATCGIEVPEVAFEPVDYPMGLVSSHDGSTKDYMTGNPGLANYAWYWVRVEVESVEYVGLMYMGAGV